MTFLALGAITRQWDGQGGVVDINLSLPKGAFLSILGPSGCGKSTLLRLIAGLEHPQSGQIVIDGRDVTALPPAERNLSMVFQSYALFPHLSVAENVLFGLKVRRIARAERDARLAEVLEMTGLKGLEKRKPSELSGGQRQRVALARAAVAQKPLCLMDEPLSNLDAKLRNSVRRDIRALSRKLGLTVVYVTHDQGEAMSLSDKVVLMNNGQIEQVGTPAELYNRPATTFAAQFIGEPPMALINGAALGYDAGYTVGIRPEAVRVVPAGQGDLDVIVDDLEFMGNETQLAFTHPAATGLAAILNDNARPDLGQTTGVRLPEESRLLFSAVTGTLEKEPQQNS
ncbi:ABC transporter ATP-binding protein [Pseudooceanicola algae]|uniref:sn-glycerol-3-phosphate import ATP-binding protein UgpC n=1 Tax=Pseudooceanicola algae TaxID=1537215 RepID=A0A418SL12_9RHOB|nr:ABC transporter ATP-binding protein [Pseudooceanicola algae]QPM90896.1 sn-glycerol-3-phosphate import ATP-binding protein UgpC [Pseudooceanicola algae]